MSKFTYAQISPSHRLSISSLSSLSSDSQTFLTFTDPPPSTYPTIPSSYSPTSTDLVYGVLLLQYSLLPYSNWTKDDSKELCDKVNALKLKSPFPPLSKLNPQTPPPLTPSILSHLNPTSLPVPPTLETLSLLLPPLSTLTHECNLKVLLTLLEMTRTSTDLGTTFDERRFGESNSKGCQYYSEIGRLLLSSTPLLSTSNPTFSLPNQDLPDIYGSLYDATLLLTSTFTNEINTFTFNKSLTNNMSYFVSEIKMKLDITSMEISYDNIMKYYEENKEKQNDTKDIQVDEKEQKEDPRKAKEFEGKSEAQITKILKKRAEKEAKAAAKAAAKALKKSGSTSSIPSLISNVLSTLSSTPLDDSTFPSLPLLSSSQTALSLILSSAPISRKPKVAKGMRDYLPSQMKIRQKAFEIIRGVFGTHGAVEIDTPIMELKSTLTGKYGEDTKLIYDLADQGGESLALRYDLTVPFARFLALNSVGKIKRFHIGKVYRRDQPQMAKGRYREFYQCDFDIAGVYPRMVADAECICVAAEILEALPIGEFMIKVNHRKLLDAILEVCGVGPDKFRTICSAVDKLDKEPWEVVKIEMIEKGITETVADKIGTFVLQKSEKTPFDLLDKLTSSNAFGSHIGASTALEDLRLMFTYLSSMGCLPYLSFDLSLARGLDYYTGCIYEAVSLSGITGSIGGGGRYDGLAGRFCGEDIPCVGVSVGIERVFTIMEKKLKDEKQVANVQVLVASTSSNDSATCRKFEVAKRMWKGQISAEVSTMKLKMAIQDALARNVPYVIVVGDEEWERGKVKVKVLETKEEEEVDLKEIGEFLKERGATAGGGGGEKSEEKGEIKKSASVGKSKKVFAWGEKDFIR
ncbi:hypothetical protein TrVE_jg8634 [Triparma verrucosa]|uniref:Histidine--tRNA ligase, cytoplasmic n=1 Tax=Triparma verrucosa TaxID=1606542 RepID=A0A9W7AZF2_9STRA|nr:hypothetical protein TrVE_jg8634 [Triparma verrucosa]